MSSFASRVGRYGVIGLLALSPLGLAGCGAAVGGAAGGLAGNQIGSGNGKTAATIGGAAAGALIGNSMTGGR
jgi:outer membrane lipoprotein SlyB